MALCSGNLSTWGLREYFQKGTTSMERCQKTNQCGLLHKAIHFLSTLTRFYGIGSRDFNFNAKDILQKFYPPTENTFHLQWLSASRFHKLHREGVFCHFFFHG